jgi:MFS family permease
VLVVITLIAFEAMAVTTAMPTAARELGGLAYYAWAFSGFIVANIVGIVTAGVLSDRRGPKPPLVVGLAAFLGGLLLAGSATTMFQLIGGRVVQGFGAGLLGTAIYVVVGESYPEHLRPKIFAAMSSAWVLPGLAGPPISGLLTQAVGWRWVFFALTPIVLIGTLLMVPQLRSMSMRPRSAGSADSRRRLIRAVVVACGVALLIQAGQDPTVTLLGLALPALVAVGWGLHGLTPAGTIAMRRGVPAAIVLRGLLSGALFGADAYIPLALSVQHGASPALAGLPLVGSAVFWSVGSWVQGRDSMNGHRQVLIRYGFASLSLGLVLAAAASTPGAPGWLMYVAWPFAGLGAGFANSNIAVLVLGQTTDADRARDSAALQLADGVTSAFTIGLGGVLVAAAAHHHVGYTTAFVGLDLTMVVLSGLGILTSARILKTRS